MDLKSKKAWIFDMDGTLTIPKHDFMAIMDELGIPLDQDIISFIESKDEEESARLHKRLEEIEHHVATLGEAQPGCIEFLSLLQQRGCALGIVTRNNLPNTLTTLDASGLAPYFTQEATKTRESSAPKPAPDALHQLLELWQISPDDALMVGDYKYDIEAGIAASMDTIFFDSHGQSQWNDLADITVRSFQELRSLLED